MKINFPKVKKEYISDLGVGSTFYYPESKTKETSIYMVVENGGVYTRYAPNKVIAINLKNGHVRGFKSGVDRAEIVNAEVVIK